MTINWDAFEAQREHDAGLDITCNVCDELTEDCRCVDVDAAYDAWRDSQLEEK